MEFVLYITAYIRDVEQRVEVLFRQTDIDDVSAVIKPSESFVIDNSRVLCKVIIITFPLFK